MPLEQIDLDALQRVIASADEPTALKKVSVRWLAAAHAELQALRAAVPDLDLQAGAVSKGVATA